MIRNYLYWTSGAYKRRRDVKWHHSGKDTKAMRGRAGLCERLVNGQDDLGCLLESPLSTPPAPTVPRAAPHTPGDTEPGKKNHIAEWKGRFVCHGTGMLMCTTQVCLYPWDNSLTLASRHLCCLLRHVHCRDFYIARGNFHSEEVKCTFCTFYKHAAALQLRVQHEIAGISAAFVLLKLFN